MKRFLKAYILRPLAALSIASVMQVASAKQLAPPKYQVVDELGVNVHSGQVVVSIDTLSIGGDFGLSHSVSSSTSNFIQQNSGGAFEGISDKYFGSALYTMVASRETLFSPQDKYSEHNPNDHFRDVHAGIWVMRVHDHQDSVDFKIMQGSFARGYFSSDSTNYFYEALGDKRHVLVIPDDKPGHLLWTKPDGTKVWFRRGTANVTARSGGTIEKIEYPNGFTLYLNRSPGHSEAIDSVSTNTGFQLKYNYVFDYTESYGIAKDNSHHENPPESNATWSSVNPQSVVGINNALERCGHDRDTVCILPEDPCPEFESRSNQQCQRLEGKWPSAEFRWPKGMPRAAFFGETTFSVVDSEGRTTEVNLRAYDKYANADGQPIASGYPTGEAFVPRIVSIKPAHSRSPTLFYTYRNHPRLHTSDIRWSQGEQSNGVPGAYIYSVPGDTALVHTARSLNGSAVYGRGLAQDIYPYAVLYQGAERLAAKKLHQLFGGLMYVQSLRGITTFHQDYRNFPEVYASADEPAESYFYDDRGNVRKIIYQGHGENGSTFSVEASYPESNECNNPKTCNKPIWTTDAKGNKTHYSYHEASGQVQSITYPKNQRGIAAQTRFEYKQYHARYIHADGQKKESEDPIWLLAFESYCIDSAYTDGACSGDDEVVKTFAYDSDNLYLTSVTVSDPFTSKVQVTCYDYDRYGNKIGVTTPKGSCN